MAGSMCVTGLVMSRQAMWLERIEKRIAATTTMLGSMKGVKMGGLTNTLSKTIHDLRIEELNVSKRFRKLLIWNMVFSAYLDTPCGASADPMHSISHPCCRPNSDLRRLLGACQRSWRQQYIRHGQDLHLVIAFHAPVGSIRLIHHVASDIHGGCRFL
jgi:hypothetical protein